VLVLGTWAANVVSPAAGVVAAQAFIANNPLRVNAGDINLDFLTEGALVDQLRGMYTQALAAHAPVLQSLTTVRFGSTVVTCPLHAIRWTGVVLDTVEWPDSHATLTHWLADWTFAGPTYGKPEWNGAAAISNPVTVTAGILLTLNVQLTVAPPFASAENCHIVGLHGGSVLFEALAQLHGGQQTVQIRGIAPSLNIVREGNVAIQWMVRCADDQQFNAGTNANHVFFLLGAPIAGGAPEDGPTLKRMQAAMQAVGQAQAVSPDISFNIIAGLWPHFPNYVLVNDPTLPGAYNHPNFFNAAGGAWPIMDHVASGAECQAIVRFVKGILNQIGSPAQTTGVLVWADPLNPNLALESPLGAGGLGGRTALVNGVTWYASLADGPIFAGQPVPQGTRLNNFEACLRYANGGAVGYFPGGVQALRPSADAVLRGFTALVWTSTRFDLFGNPTLFCEQVLRYYP
jgi:hypothetical protein